MTTTYSPAAWAAARAEITTCLRQRAADRQMITYSELVSRIHALPLDAHDARLALLLDEVSRAEARAGAGMLTALVVHKLGSMEPGAGFFKLAKELGHQFRDDKNARTAFWIEEVKRVFAKWRTA